MACAQIEYLEDSLRRAEQRYSEAHNALGDAQVAFDEARRTLDALAAEVNTLDASRLSLRRDISSRRRALETARQDAHVVRIRRLLGSFPCELLRCIFLETMHCIEREVWPENEDWGGIWDEDHRRSPFFLAAVNQKWRDVAIHAPALWTFVAVESLEDRDASADLAYVKLLLKRSKKNHLDILLLWDDCDWASSTYYADILCALGRHTQRWKRLSVTIPLGTPASALHPFRLPMPALEGFIFDRDNETHMPSLAGAGTYFPFCPLLRRAENTVFFSVPKAPLVHLTDLYASIDDTPSSAVHALLTMIPSIERLCIAFEIDMDDVAPSNPPEPVALPKLQDLRLTGWGERFSPWTSCLEMPLLRVLRLDSDSIGVFSTLLEHVADTVHTLAISAMSADFFLADPEHMAHIRKMPKLRSLFMRGYTAVGPQFASVFASRAAAGLPVLETIGIEEPTLDEQEAAHVSCLMQKLHAAGAEGAISLRLTVAKDEDVPAWLLRQYKFITTGQHDNSDSDGSADADAERSDSSESEAQFTDGDSGEAYTSDSDWEGSESEEQEDEVHEMEI